MRKKAGKKGDEKELPRLATPSLHFRKEKTGIVGSSSEEMQGNRIKCRKCSGDCRIRR